MYSRRIQRATILDITLSVAKKDQCCLRAQAVDGLGFQTLGDNSTG